jgi:hypothetical protein
MKGIVRLASLLALAVVPLIPPQIALAQPQPLTAASQSCQLNNGIKHVILVTFDNTHLFPDRPGVPSDLEQMPNLLNFMRGNGTLSDNEHTILISHTAGGILSSLTGLYPDRMGITVSNSYRYFTPTGSSSSTAFKYWTDRVDDSGVNDPLPNMVTTGGLNTPAPWVAYTRAGCDFGGVATANVVLENTSTTQFGDMTTVFGSGSPDWTAAKNASTAPTAKERAKPQADYVGFAIHCGQGGGICNGQSGARPDLLPDEPGGYTGFKGLFGAKYVNPAITGGQAAVNDLNGQPIQDPFQQPGFPGFDAMFATNTLGYVAQMQEAGVPITYAYISDAHDNHTLFRASGPGEADYRAQLQAYDQAFGAFFTRLAAHGINKSNTIFAFTSDENDHYAGGNSTDGTWSHTFCNITLGPTCPANQIGEVNQNITKVLPAGYTPPAFLVHSDSAPTVYVTNGTMGRTDPVVRDLERKLAAANAVDPYVSSSPTPLTLYMADPVEQKALHMVNADPRRTPTFTLFANPDYFLSTFDSACKDGVVLPTDPRYASCIDYHFAWSHGDFTEDIGRTWLGIVGPGIKHLGQTSRTWSDHTDIQPTILALLGLKDSYEPDGAVLADFLETSAVSRDLRAHHESLVRLHELYKSITAPFGQYAHDTLVASTAGIKSGATGSDGHYDSVESQIETLTSERDALAAQMRTALTVATFGGGDGSSEQDLKAMIDHGQAILAQAAALAASA